MRRIIRMQFILSFAATLAVAVGVGHLPAASAAGRIPQPCFLAKTLDGKLNINTATAEQWALLPGIGPAIAARLVAYRSERPFTHVSHVMRVKGIGRKTYAAIRPYLTTEGETTLRVADDRSRPDPSRLPPDLPPLPSVPVLP